VESASANPAPFDTIPHLVWTCTPDGTCDYVNRHWTELTGLPLESARGRGWAQAVHPDDRQRYGAEFLKAAAAGTPFEHELRYLCAAGAYRWVLVRAAPLRDAGGNIVQWVGTCTDIDAKVQAERALRQSEERVRIATEAGHIGTWQWDIEADRVVWSALLYEMHGLSRAEFGGRVADFERIVHPDDLERVGRAIKETLEEGADYTLEFRARGPHGGYHWFWTRAMVIRDGAGRPLRMVGAITDITARKRAEEHLREVDRKKDEFLAMLAHELRNPLAPIRNGIELLRYAVPPEERLDRILAMLGRQTTHLTRLVDDLLDVSRITQNKITLKRETLRLGDLVLEVVNDVRADFDRGEIQLACALPPGEIWVDGDRTRLAQALGNLLHNAMKFSRPGGHAWVRLGVVQGRAELCVEDDGMGIEAGMMPVIFEPFAQAAQSAERTQGGLGLGLALVKGLVALHGGSVSAHSAGQGEGARFTIRLPIARVVEVNVEAPAVVAAGARRRVLIVEDNPDAADSMEMLISLWGHEVRLAPTGRRALDILEHWLPEIVLCDIGLPEMDGYGVCREIRRRAGTEGVILVALTGYGRDVDVQEARAAGFRLHLTKPVEPQKLRRIVQDLGEPGA
jgi:PAS domain S-box-containing protein